MNFLVLAIIIIALFLLYHIACPKPAEKKKDEKMPLPPPYYDYEAVVKSRFVLPDRSNSATLPVQHDDIAENSGKQDRKPDIFAAGNENPLLAIIPSGEINELFCNEVNPEDLDIERDENETGEDDEPDFDADDEAEEILQSVREIAGYAGGFTYDELATLIHESDKQPETTTKVFVETLRDFSKTDMFEQLVSGDAGRAARIAAILDRSEQSLTGQSENPEDNANSEYRNFDIGQFLS
jgi:hypothetical protein